MCVPLQLSIRQAPMVSTQSLFLEIHAFMRSGVRTSPRSLLRSEDCTTRNQ